MSEKEKSHQSEKTNETSKGRVTGSIYGIDRIAPRSEHSLSISDFGSLAPGGGIAIPQDTAPKDSAGTNTPSNTPSNTNTGGSGSDSAGTSNNK